MTQRLCDPLPYTVEFEGKTLEINPYFDNVLDVLSVFDDASRTEEEKVMYAYAVLVKRKSGDMAYQGRVIQHIAETILFPDKQEKKHNERSFDFIQDAPYIYAAYRQAYGIDLFAEQGMLHWWAFLYLFKGLPENTRMMEIIKIRTQPSTTQSTDRRYPGPSCKWRSRCRRQNGSGVHGNPWKRLPKR